MKIFKDPRILVQGIAILILVVVGGIFASRYISGLKEDHITQDAKDLYYAAAEESSTQEKSSETAEVESIDEEISEESKKELMTFDENGNPVVSEDFKELLELNDEIVGWLTVGESIDYPVVQGNNDYYLSHNYKNEPDSHGAVFVNSCNSLWPRDDILLIHAHNMGDGRMFNKLPEFLKYRYLCEYPVVMFRTIYENEPVYYTPVTSFVAQQFKDSPDRYDIGRILFEDDPEQPEEGRASADFQNYLDGCAYRSNWAPLVDFSVNDEYIMLITCSNSREYESRYGLLCRKLRPDETPESIEALYSAELNK